MQEKSVPTTILGSFAWQNRIVNPKRNPIGLSVSKSDKGVKPDRLKKPGLLPQIITIWNSGKFNNNGEYYTQLGILTEGIHCIKSA